MSAVIPSPCLLEFDGNVVPVSHFQPARRIVQSTPNYSLQREGLKYYSTIITVLLLLLWLLVLAC